MSSTSLAADDSAVARELRPDLGLELHDALAESGRNLVGEHEVVKQVELPPGHAVRAGLARTPDRAEELGVR